MIPGPYSVCNIRYQSDDADTFDLLTLKWVYDSVDEARRNFAKLEESEGISVEDLCVVRVFGPDEVE